MELKLCLSVFSQAKFVRVLVPAISVGVGALLYRTFLTYRRAKEARAIKGGLNGISGDTKKDVDSDEHKTSGETIKHADSGELNGVETGGQPQANANSDALNDTETGGQPQADAYMRQAKMHERMDELDKCVENATIVFILNKGQGEEIINYIVNMLRKLAIFEVVRLNCIRENQPYILVSKTYIKSYLRQFVNDPMQQEIPLSAVEVPRGYKRANQALREQDYDSVIPACTEELESAEPEAKYRMEALLLRGMMYMLSGAYQEAKQDLEAVIDNAEADVTLRIYALLRHAITCDQIDKIDEALADFDVALELQPDNADIYHQRSQFFFKHYRLSEAFTDVQQAGRLAPDHAVTHIARLSIEYSILKETEYGKRFHPLIWEVQEVSERDPHCIEAFMLLGKIYGEHRRYQLSCVSYKRAMHIEPENAFLRAEYAVTKYSWNDNIDAYVKSLEEAVHLDDKCHKTLMILANFEMLRNNLQRASELLKEAIKRAKAYKTLMELYYQYHGCVSQLKAVETLRANAN